MKVTVMDGPSVGLYDVATGHGFVHGGRYYVRLDTEVEICGWSDNLVLVADLGSGMMCIFNKYTHVVRVSLEVIAKPCESSS